jgi:hypothetical protein
MLQLKELDELGLWRLLEIDHTEVKQSRRVVCLDAVPGKFCLGEGERREWMARYVFRIHGV